jgi:hypothetical protein
MIAIFSGHTEIDVGNVYNDISEHRLAKEIITLTGCKINVNYNAEQCEMKYRILKKLHDDTAIDLCILLHFPASYNRQMNATSIIYHEYDYTGYALSMKLSELCDSAGLKPELFPHSQSNFTCNFLMKKAVVPVIVFEPFYLSHVGNNAMGQAQRCSLILKGLSKHLRQVKKNLD